MNRRGGATLHRSSACRRRLLDHALPLLLAAALGCAPEAQTPSLETPTDGPDQILWDFTTTEADSGRLNWIFRAEQALVYQATKRIESRAIRVDMYGEGGQINSTLTADSGRIDQRSGAMTAIGNVHVVSADDYDLRTEVLHWDRERELFHTEAYVEVRHGENLTTGLGMECDGRLDHLRILREPSGVIVQREEAAP